LDSQDVQARPDARSVRRLNRKEEEPARNFPGIQFPAIAVQKPRVAHLSKALSRRPANPFRLSLQLLMLCAAGVLFALHAVHLRADFPNFSRWMDWSKYTDEGWYGDAAIRHFQLGHWYVPGDFNPAAALPVWPLLEGILFQFTGVSLLAARALTVAVFGGILVCAWALIERWRPVQPDGSRPGSLAASASVLLLAASPFCFVFTRLAILEPPLIFFLLLALLAAGAVRPPNSSKSAGSTPAALRANWMPVLALGVLLPVLVLTKTTALFLFPAIAWLLFAACRYRARLFLTLGLPAGALGGLLWLAFFVLAVRPHYLLDYRYLFSANGYTGITRATFFPVLADTVRDGNWMGRAMFALAVAAVTWSAIRIRQLRHTPLVVALILWSGGYAAFLAYHDNLQPRYYLVVAVPLTMLVPVVTEHLLLPLFRGPAAHRVALGLAGLAVLAVAIPDALQTVRFVRHPEYTLLDAADSVRDYIAEDRLKDPTHSPLVLSISGSDMALMAGIPAIDDDFGTLELDDRVNLYRPGWYVAWNEIDDDKMDAMTPLFHVERVAAFPAMDDPDRNLLILYKLEPAAPTPPPRRTRKPMPKRLRTKVGQQPSEEQLQH
jgi:4-amino-4-deoxy-L-arabinose transferase-like glycosyltransferase